MDQVNQSLLEAASVGDVQKLEVTTYLPLSTGRAGAFLTECQCQSLSATVGEVPCTMLSVNDRARPGPEFRGVRDLSGRVVLVPSSSPKDPPAS